jgi:hypothetical protein
MSEKPGRFSRISLNLLARFDDNARRGGVHRTAVSIDEGFSFLALLTIGEGMARPPKRSSRGQIGGDACATRIVVVSRRSRKSMCEKKPASAGFLERRFGAARD